MGRQTTDVGMRAFSWWPADMPGAAAGPDIRGIRACTTGEIFFRHGEQRSNAGVSAAQIVPGMKLPSLFYQLLEYWFGL